MTISSGKAAVILVAAVAALYLTGLTRMGMLSTDEPRYAAIGRAMAESGDWITPRLWGEPWFEKPALLYWMTAAGFRSGLGPDLAPRLPVALLSVAFLVFFRWRLALVFDEAVANCSTAILATTAGWLAYSHVAVTDLPLAVFFSAAVLFSLPAGEGEDQPPRVAAAIALGLAVLAKGLPPLVLFLPVLALDYRNWRRWFASWPILVFSAVGLPWYILCTLRNGRSFLYILFIQQQFDRFRTDALQHMQPWWFYGPVFLLLLYPWFPLLLAVAARYPREPRTRLLTAVVATGLIFFSASVNKLPGYLLPLIPATCALMGFALARTSRAERWVIAPIALLGIMPFATSIVPEALAHGLAHGLRAAQFSWTWAALGFSAAAVAGWVGCGMAGWLRPRAALPLAVLLAAAGFFRAEVYLFPALDQAGSARSLWSGSHPECAPVLPRGMLYGLYYYSEKRLPDCAIVDKKAAPPGGSGQTH